MKVDSVRHWFDVAREAQYDYAPAYQSFIFTNLPRWHGNIGALWALAVEWLEEDRFDTDVPYQSITAIDWIARELKREKEAEIFQDEAPYRLAATVLEGLAEDPAHDASSRRDNTRAELLSRLASIAMATGREDEARALCDVLADDDLAFHESLLPRYGLITRFSVPRLLARTGTASDAVERAASEAAKTFEGEIDRREAFEKLITLYKDAKRLTADPRADGYFDCKIRESAFRRDFLSGNWVDMQIDDRLLDWYSSHGGIVDVEGQSVVLRESDTTSAASLRSGMYVLKPFEVQCVIEPFYETGNSAFSGIGILGKGNNNLVFWVNGMSNRVDISQGNDNKGREHTHYGQISDKPSHQLTVRIWPGYVEYLVDGQQKVAKEVDGFRPYGFFSLKCVARRRHSAEVRFKDVRIRQLAPREPKIDQGEPPPDSSE